MTITAFIRYRLDPYKRADFEEYARRWLKIIPRCGGDLIGYWMPHDGTDNIAYGPISFRSLADYESLSGAPEDRRRGRGELHRRAKRALYCLRGTNFLRQVE
jgi:hypothetical protein